MKMDTDSNLEKTEKSQSSQKSLPTANITNCSTNLNSNYVNALNSTSQNTTSSKFSLNSGTSNSSEFQHTDISKNNIFKFSCKVCKLNSGTLDYVDSVCSLTHFNHTEFQLIISQPSIFVNIKQFDFKQNSITYLCTETFDSELLNKVSLSSTEKKKLEKNMLAECKILITSKSNQAIILNFESNTESYKNFKFFCTNSLFIARTDEHSAQQYFHFYSLLSQQQNMMNDYVRTGTYQQAMFSNANVFKDKIVMDCGAGTGILSFFSIQAGAKKCYAVEGSNGKIR